MKKNRFDSDFRPPSDEVVAAVMRDIQQGFDNARKHGVSVSYPMEVTIDGLVYPVYPFFSTPQASGDPK